MEMGGGEGEIRERGRGGGKTGKGRERGKGKHNRQIHVDYTSKLVDARTHSHTPWKKRPPTNHY